jgi:hypothetical protein
MQDRLHPTLLKDMAVEPGRKWKNGFFSIGSGCIDDASP